MRAVFNVVLSCQIIGSLAFGTYGFVGSKCTLGNGVEGVCTEINNCREELQKVIEGRWVWNSTVTCGFHNFTEIVCCAVDVSQRFDRRPAEMACQEYREQYYKDSERRKKTFNENEAQDAEFPYVVALGYKNNDNNVGAPRIQYSCEGTLISDEYVLTAAHCVNNLGHYVPVEVRLGDRELNSTDAISIPIEEITAHPEYRPRIYYNDLAIIKLKTKVQMSHKIQPICLRTQNLPLATSLLVIGWGGDRIHSEGSNKLLKSNDLRIVDKEECKKYYCPLTDRIPDGIVDSQVCVMSKGSMGAKACVGRSGSPLLMLTDSQDTLVGVSGFGRDCGDRFPAVYTAVYSHFLDWIEEKVWPTQYRISPTGNVFNEDALLLHK